MADADEAWGLTLAFDTDDPEFIRGFEAGALWRSLDFGGVEDQYVRAESSEMVMRIAEAKGRRFSAKVVDDQWLSVSIS